VSLKKLSKLRVAHLTSAHPRDDIRIFHKQCLSLERAGFSVLLVVADGLGSDATRGIEIHDVGLSRGRVDRVLRICRLVFRKAVELDADLYHLHDPELLWAGLMLQRRGKRVVFDSHEDVPLQLLGKPYLNPVVRGFVAKFYRVVEKFCCKRFSGVIAATPTIRDKFLAIHSKTVDICNFPMLEEFATNVQWAEKMDEVCYVGGLSQIRGLWEMVAAMNILPGATRLNLVGGFSSPQDRELICREPGWCRVNETGVLDRAGVATVYRRSFAGMVTLKPLPNYIEALPIKMFEYMAAGIPVIASNFPLWKSIVAEHSCGLCVDPNDVRAIAGAIVKLTAAPDDARAMGENGRRAVLTIYNWKAEETKLIAFYAELLSISPESVNKEV
jgi:glycosyltransferase involved in cell wall biosynthesis